MVTISAFADEIGPELKLQMDACEASAVKCIDVRGIDGVNVSKMTVAQARGYRRQLDGRGFSVPCIGSPIGKIRMDEDFAEHLELLKHCFDVAEAFGTQRIRIFSFYPPRGETIAAHRSGVMDRMAAMVKAAEAAGMVLLHENEKAIYGARPAGVKDLFATIRSKSFLGVFDPSNYVEEGIAPFDEGWKVGLAELTHDFHVKDKVPGQKACVPAGEGAGQFLEIFRDLKARNFSGVMTLEPHLKQAKQFTGFTGPELFTKAATALKALLDKVGLAYR